MLYHYLLKTKQPFWIAIWYQWARSIYPTPSQPPPSPSTSTITSIITSIITLTWSVNMWSWELFSSAAFSLIPFKVTIVEHHEFQQLVPSTKQFLLQLQLHGFPSGWGRTWSLEHRKLRSGWLDSSTPLVVRTLMKNLIETQKVGDCILATPLDLDLFKGGWILQHLLLSKLE